jgi:serine/threonine protein kinase
MVVAVIKHARLPHSPSSYYIDMEYCPETLEMRIHGAFRGSDPQPSTMNGGSTPVRMMHVQHVTLPGLQPTTMNQGLAPLSSRTDAGSVMSTTTIDENHEIDCQSIIDILREINEALVYIHSHGVVHRDLKPKNGTSLQHSDQL